MENLQTYLDQIVFWVVTAISALGGSTISIGAIVLWIRKIIYSCAEKLLDQTVDYSDKVERIDKVAAELLGVDGMLKQMSERLDGFQKDYDELKARFNASEERNDQLLQVIYIMASNTPTLVSNGAAGKIAKIIGIAKDDVTVGDVNNETDS